MYADDRAADVREVRDVHSAVARPDDAQHEVEPEQPDGERARAHRHDEQRDTSSSSGHCIAYAVITPNTGADAPTSPPAANEQHLERDAAEPHRRDRTRRISS